MPNFPSAVPRDNWQKHGERVSVLDFDALADGVLLFDGAINASDKTLTSATANFTEALIGLNVWIEDAGGSGVDFLSTVESINSPNSLEVTDNAIATVSNAEVRIGTDNTAFIQNAFDTLDGRCRRIEFPGRFLTLGKLDLRSHQLLLGHGWAYDSYNALAPSLIMCCANEPVLNNTDLVTGDGWVGGGLRHLSLRGTKRTGSKGLYTELSLGTQVDYCAFDHFGDQALQLVNGIFGIHIVGSSATNSCLVRTGRTDYVGVFDIDPSDLFMADCEVGASTSNDVGGEYGGGFIAAFRVSGNNSFIRDCMGHHSQIGWFVGPPSRPQVVTTFVNCRGDRNQGHGWVVDAYNCHFIGCRADANSFDSHGGYSGWRVLSGNHIWTSPQVDTRGDGTGVGIPENNKLKHAFHFSATSFFPPSKVIMPMIGDAFIGDSSVACTDEIYKVETGTQEPIIIDFEKNAATNEYEFLQRKAIDMQTFPIWMSSEVGAANATQWSIATKVPGLDDAFCIVAWNDARSTFVFPFSIVRNQTTGGIDYIAFKSAAFVLFDSSLTFVEFDPLALFKSGLQLEQSSAATNEKRWGVQTGVGTTAGTGEFKLAAINDAVSAATTFFNVLRTGITIDSINLTGTAINLNGNVVLGNGKYIQFNNNTTRIIAGSGSPEGVVTAVGASLFLDGTNGAVYFKVSGVGNTGWAKANAFSVTGLTTNQPLYWTGSAIGTDKIDLSDPTNKITGTLGMPNGGTGATTASGIRTAIGVHAAADVYDKTASDARYYTQAQVDTLIAGLQSQINTLQTEQGAQAADIIALQTGKADHGTYGVSGVPDVTI